VKIRPKELEQKRHPCRLVYVLFLCHCDKIPDRNDLREERFILVHRFKGFSPWLLGPVSLGRTSWGLECMVEEVLHLMVDRKHRKKKATTGDQV
jgi:hypothetical protein